MFSAHTTWHISLYYNQCRSGAYGQAPSYPYTHHYSHRLGKGALYTGDHREDKHDLNNDTDKLATSLTKAPILFSQQNPDP